MLYKKVTSKDDEILHHEFSKKAWHENNWEYENYHLERDDIHKFLVLNELGVPIGTFNFLPYKPNVKGSLTDIYSFEKEDEVKNNPNGTYEIDALFIDRKHRNNKNLVRLALSVLEACDDLDVHYIVGATKPSLIRLAKNKFKLPLKVVKEQVYYKKDDFYFDILIADMKKINKRKKLLTPIIKMFLNKKRKSSVEFI